MRHCMVLNCTNNSRKTAEISYHRVPAEKRLRQAWLARIRHSVPTIRLFVQNILRPIASRKTYLDSYLVTKTKGNLRLIRFLQYFHKEVLVTRDPPANGETLCTQEETYYFLAAKSMRIYLLIVMYIV